MIRHGYADAVITGGAEAAITRVGRCGLCQYAGLVTFRKIRMRHLCRLTSGSAGFVIGEGAVALVLEEYEHAVGSRR